MLAGSLWINLLKIDIKIKYDFGWNNIIERVGINMSLIQISLHIYFGKGHNLCALWKFEI